MAPSSHILVLACICWGSCKESEPDAGDCQLPVDVDDEGLQLLQKSSTMRIHAQFGSRVSSEATASKSGFTKRVYGAMRPSAMVQADETNETTSCESTFHYAEAVALKLVQKVTVFDADKIEKHSFDVASVAGAATEKGLGGRYLKPDHGMLLDFSPPMAPCAPICFCWQKCMFIGLDIIFIKDGKIALITQVPASPAATPDYLVPTVQLNEPITHVLELNSGTTLKYGITVGDTISIADLPKPIDTIVGQPL